MKQQHFADNEKLMKQQHFADNVSREAGKCETEWRVRISERKI